MKYFIQFLIVALTIVTLRAEDFDNGCYDRNAYYVNNKDACDSGCQYYGKQCPVKTVLPTGPGYDCNQGYCRLKTGAQCIEVDTNAVYAENIDACESLCRYVNGCPIRPTSPTPPGFNCKPGYCRRERCDRCMKTNCYDNSQINTQ